MIETTELLPGIRFHCCQNTRFKQGALSIQFIRPMKQEEAAANALLPAVLLLLDKLIVHTTADMRCLK